MKIDNIPICNWRIKQSRLAKKISQSELAKYTGVSKNYISMIETGVRNPGEGFLRKLGNFLAADYDWLVSDYYTDKDALLEAGGHKNLVNQFDGRRLQTTPLGLTRNIADIDFSLIVWMLCRHGNLSFSELAQKIDINESRLHEYTFDSFNDINQQTVENALSLLSELDDFPASFSKISSTIQLLKSEYDYQRLEVIRGIMKTYLENKYTAPLTTGFISESGIPGISGNFQLFNDAGGRTWHCFVCGQANGQKFKRIADTVIEQTKVYPESHVVVWITTNAASLSNMLNATQDFEERLCDAPPSYAVALLDDTTGECITFPCT